MFTPLEVAAKLKVTRRSVYRWLAIGELRGVRAGGQWRFSEDDIQKFLNANILRRRRLDETRRALPERRTLLDADRFPVSIQW